jgi:hypothetical protein
MREHRAIGLVQDVLPHLNDVVGPHSDNVRVKRGMMDLAHGDPIRNYRLAALGIASDMSGVEQFNMAQATEGALTLIRENHSGAEDWLVKALVHYLKPIAGARLGHALRA